MMLSAGMRLGPYEVLSAIGAGGMGEVYRARDTRLDRMVAIKTLTPRLAEDPLFRERFEREARSVSRLSHPHICTLHDVGTESGQTRQPIYFLVLEYLEGETLGARLRRGSLPVDDVLRIGSEIASALESAHRQGVVHRDLKPGNVMLTKGGAKLLDFGLAKLAAPAGDVQSAVAPQATETAFITSEGAILGTLPYMAPEQLESAEADARSDLFAFGAVMYEMLTGRAAFHGASRASLVGAILRDEPPPITQPGVPPALDRLVRACLAKDPTRRVQSAHDVWLQLKWIAESADDRPETLAMPSGRRVRPILWSALALGTAAVAAMAAWLLKTPPADRLIAARFQYSLPESQNFSGTTRHVVAISPDGTKLAYTANRQLYLRGLNQLEGQPIRGTADTAPPIEPVFSPDGQSIVYFAVELSSRVGSPTFAVKRVAVAGGTPVTLAQIAAPPFGASWHGGMIVVGQGEGGIQAIPDDGGSPRTVVTVDSKLERAVQPELLDDGRHILFAVPSPLNTGRETASGEGPIVVQEIGSGTRKVLVPMGTNPRVLATGQLLFIHDRKLMAVGFDAKRLEVTGTPAPLVEGVARSGASAAFQFAVSRTGTLVYVPGAFADATRELVWVGRQGDEQAIAAAPGNYQQPRMSPDGKRLAVSKAANIWIWSFTTDTLTRLTNEPAVQYNPAWTPDGRHIVYDWNDGLGVAIVRRAADGTGSAETVAPAPAGYPEIVTPDSKSIIYHPVERVAMVLPMDPKGPARRLLPNVDAQVSDAEISPSGRWMADQSTESGRFEVYVRPFPDVDASRWQVSSNGGLHPLWSRDGRELFFIAGDGMMMSVPIQPGADIRAREAGSSVPRRQILRQCRPWLRRLARRQTFPHDQERRRSPLDDRDHELDRRSASGAGDEGLIDG